MILHWDLYYEAIPRHFTIWGLFNAPPSLSWTNNLQGRFKEGELILELRCGWIFIHPKRNRNFATSLKLKLIYCSWNEVLQASSGIEKPKITWSLIWRVHVWEKETHVKVLVLLCTFSVWRCENTLIRTQIHTTYGCTSSMVQGCLDPDSVSHYLKVDFRWSVVFGPLYY